MEQTKQENSLESTRDTAGEPNGHGGLNKHRR